jgi:hypothetical protein
MPTPAPSFTITTHNDQAASRPAPWPSTTAARSLEPTTVAAGSTAYDNGTSATLTAPGATAGTLADAINDRGEVAGYYLDSSGDLHGFVYNITAGSPRWMPRVPPSHAQRSFAPKLGSRQGPWGAISASTSAGPHVPGAYGYSAVTSSSTGSTIRHCASTMSCRP